MDNIVGRFQLMLEQLAKKASTVRRPRGLIVCSNHHRLTEQMVDCIAALDRAKIPFKVVKHDSTIEVAGIVVKFMHLGNLRMKVQGMEFNEMYEDHLSSSGRMTTYDWDSLFIARSRVR